jgi:hypothetical protein
MKHDCDAAMPCPLHQLVARRMAAVGQEDVGPKSLEDLVGQLEKDSRLARIR